MNNQMLDELAERVRKLGAAQVAEIAGIKPRKVSRFMNAPKSVTMAELSRIQSAVHSLDSE